MQASDDEDEKNPQPKADHIAEETEKAAAEETVQDSSLPSDRTIFAYYFSSIGFANIFIIIGLIACYTVVVNFRSELFC